MIRAVSVVDSISATSMPINEFVIYRSAHQYDIQQTLIVCDTKSPENVMIPADVDVHLVGGSKGKLRALIKRLKAEAGQADETLVFHLHHQKSALQFFLASAFLNIRKRCLYTVHSTYSGRDIKYKVSSCLCVLLSRYANCVCNAAFSEYSRLVRYLKGKRFTAIPNGVDVDRINEALEDVQKPRGDRKTLICVGRMIPLKNHQFVIKMMKQLPQHRLILIGAEDVEGKIRALAQAEGVADRVEFRGLLPRNEVYTGLCDAAIYVSPSFVEGLPVSVLEAMCVGLVPVLSDIAPHKEIGDLCEQVCLLPLEEEAWVAAIRQLGEMEEAQFCKHCNEIRQAVANKFSLESMHGKYLDIYQKM